MVDPKALSRPLRDSISAAFANSDGIDAIAIRHLVQSHEVADAEISRLTAENASLRLAVERARNVLTNLKSWFCHRELENGDCSSLCELCRIERTLAILLAPGEPGKEIEIIRAARAVAEVRRDCENCAEGEDTEAYCELNSALDALCALVPPEGK